MPPLRLFQQGLALARQRARQSLGQALWRSPLASRLLSTSPIHRLLLRHAERPTVRRLLQQQRNAPRRPLSGGPEPAAQVPPPKKESLSLSARLRKLSREYGWSAFGVYMALTALDLPLCFLAVRWLGTERIGEWEHAAVAWLRRAMPLQLPERWGGRGAEDRAAEAAQLAVDGVDHGVREAQVANASEEASLWTQMVLAYAIHKTFIFVRVPLTAAITPKVVRTLRGWGWNIGKLTPKAEREAKRAHKLAQKEADKATKAAREAQKMMD